MAENCKEAQNLIKKIRIAVKDASEKINQIYTDAFIELGSEVTVENLFDCG